MLLMLALPGSAMAANTNCPTISGHVICADPPPATPLAPGQLQAMIDRVIAEERVILQPMTNGVDVSLCSRAIAAAQAVNRHDLVPNLQKRCGL